MASLPISRLTPDQYLAIERAAGCKSEYLAGEMLAMAGASREHNRINVNMTSLLNFQLRDRPCDTYANDMRVRTSRAGLYTYPDIVVVCGESQFIDEHNDTLINQQ